MKQFPIFSSVQQLWRQITIGRQIDSDWRASDEWQTVQTRLKAAKRVIDLGCGANPHLQASVGVDAFLQPIHRTLGRGPQIEVEYLLSTGVKFVQANLEDLPFADKEFDFAYSHHVFEHLSDPKKACSELVRIANAGAIITPSIFAEIAFGRPYHLWFVLARGDTLLFVRKNALEDRPFGDHPIVKGKSGYQVEVKTNPFDILLNDGGWYRGGESFSRLSRLLRAYWYSHSPVMEVVFPWEKTFNCVVILEDGRVE